MTHHDPPNEKCDVAEFGDRTTTHSVCETPETKSKDNNMTDFTSTTPAKATLTQKELFQRFLDAPFHEGGNLSTLVDTRRVSERTVQESFHYCSGLASGHWPDLGIGWGGMHEFLLEHLRESDEPEFDLEEIVGDIAGMLRDFENLKRGFDAVCAVTRADAPDEDAPDEVHRDWEDNPQYVLPVVATKAEGAAA